ncbi:hypothetical protein DFH29DRAFT_935376 [Suillus ampliporus]|nr:hypothetical protein DFH29DRAFT_935376 [Suillus ampliporus]
MLFPSHRPLAHVLVLAFLRLGTVLKMAFSFCAKSTHEPNRTIFCREIEDQTVSIWFLEAHFEESKFPETFCV